ncbi:hypothetical protein WMY93_015999 [Mugilogobius chulae]|uniref:Uncharacterized protein n=1 Tax=Mugilogobius chulae TaxID=88201 RepID=A0AAW0NU95_9GOBI
MSGLPSVDEGRQAPKCRAIKERVRETTRVSASAESGARGCVEPDEVTWGCQRASERFTTRREKYVATQISFSAAEAGKWHGGIKCLRETNYLAPSEDVWLKPSELLLEEEMERGGRADGTGAGVREREREKQRERETREEVSSAHTSHYQPDSSEKTTARRNTRTQRQVLLAWTGPRVPLPRLLLLALCPGRRASERALSSTSSSPTADKLEESSFGGTTSAELYKNNCKLRTRSVPAAASPSGPLRCFTPRDRMKDAGARKVER